MLNNQKITGAFIVGFALVFGAYTISNFGFKTNTVPTNQNELSKADTDVYAVVGKQVNRQYIPVADADQNGIEDWQEEFVPMTPVMIDSTSTAVASFDLPKTVTDQVGIQLLQSVLRAKGQGPVGQSKAQVVKDTAEILRTTVIKDTVYDVSSIQVVENSPEAIRNYGNRLGEILINNNVVGSEGELAIIQRALQTENVKYLDNLDPIINMYKTLRDETLVTPVPRGFERQHVTLINVYQAMYATLDGMKLAFTDPVVALLRVKRYQDDATGLAIGLQNMYKALLPNAQLFNRNDPAAVFLEFSPQ